jgi:hypothetical protein
MHPDAGSGNEIKAKNAEAEAIQKCSKRDMLFPVQDSRRHARQQTDFL